jgi:hypothetical protein
MNNELQGCQPMERKTLINAFERLSGKCNQLREVANLTDRLTAKLHRTEDEPRPTDEKVKQENKRMDIVDLFNSIADDMEIQINRIGSNTEEAINIIE